jgi:hypothetical protein
MNPPAWQHPANGNCDPQKYRNTVHLIAIRDAAVIFTP